MSNTCGNCKHWGTEKEARNGEIYRTCQAINHSSHFYFSSNGKGETALAATNDCSDCGSALNCREAFGCVLWESKVN